MEDNNEWWWVVHLDMGMNRNALLDLFCSCEDNPS